MTGSTDSEDLEIRIIRELTAIRLELQELRQLHASSELKFKIAIAEHQTHCPLMSKHLITKETCYADWQDCYQRHKKETGKGFDLWFERGKRLLVLAGTVYIVASNINWQAIIGGLK